MKRKDKKIVLFSDNAEQNETKAPLEEEVAEVPEYNDYFLTVSSRYRTAKILCVFILCVFILSSMLIFGESLTYENARYIMRDLGQILAEDSSEPASEITFDADGNMDYTVFRGSLVVCGVSGVDIFSPSGTLKLSDHTSFISPCAIASEKYCIVYSLGAYNLSVYNTVARVYDMEFSYPIYDVAVSDDGYIAVMTQSSEYKCVVYMYDSDFKLIATYNKTNYPCSVELSDKDNSLYIATFGTKSGNYYTKIDAYDLRSENSKYSANIAAPLPYEIFVMNENNVVLLTQDHLIYLSESGDEINRINIGGNIIANHATDKYFALLSDTNCRVFDSKGSEVSSFNSNDALGIHYTDDSIILRYKTSISITPTDRSDAHTVELGHGVIKLLSKENYLYVCYSDRIIPISIK